jgi:hypothetical protein
MLATVTAKCGRKNEQCGEFERKYSAGDGAMYVPRHALGLAGGIIEWLYPITKHVN